jgi:hypothetical protein
MGTSNPVMLGTNEVIVNGRNPLLLSSSDKISVAGKVSHNPQVHHLIPKQWKTLRKVQQAIKQGFKFDGDEYKISLTRYSKLDGKGQHGNHPKYNTQIKEKIEGMSESKEGPSLLDQFRNFVKQIRQKIDDSPDTKINDLKL